MSEDTTIPEPLVFFQTMTRYYLPQAIYVAARLGIADLLADGPKSADELAQATGTHVQALGLLLRALASADMFAEHADGRYGLTPLATYLQSDTPHSQRGWALIHGETGYRTWGELMHTIKTGAPAFERAFGTSYYDYMAQHPSIAAEWDQAMDQTARDWFSVLPASYDFTPLRTLVDVGGGHGTILATILRAVPSLRGVLFDLPHVVGGAGAVLEDAGVADRCTVAGGDMFTAVPGGGDAYLIARVLFNWDDERAAAILRSCRRAMPDHARLLVIDIVEPDDNRPQGAAFGDLNLLVVFGSRQRSESEFHTLFGAAGFRVTRILPTQSHFQLVEGLPV